MKSAIWIYTVILLLTAVILSYLYFTRKFDYWKKRNIPYLKPIPFFGNLLPVLAMKTTLAEWLLDACRQMKSDYFGIFTFDQPVLVVQSPKLVKAILQKDFVYFQDRTVASFDKNPIIKNVMFVSRNPHWKSMRSMSSPVFSSGKIKQMFLHVLDEAKLMDDYISRLSNIPNVEMHEIRAKYSTNVIARCAYAITANSFENPNAEFRYPMKVSKNGHPVHPEMQDRLRTEICDNISKYNGITYEGLPEMKYLDMCVSEALRKYPVLAFLDRTCKSDDKVEGTDMVIEKGTLVYIPMLGLHYDTKYFPNPEKFDPERFFDNKNINADGFHYVPFGEGPRICIGNRFGLIAVKIAVASILSKFKLEPTEKTPIPVKLLKLFFFSRTLDFHSHLYQYKPHLV